MTDLCLGQASPFSNIVKTTNTTVSGHSVPDLTKEQVELIYNLMNVGQLSIIKDANNINYLVNQADHIDGATTVEFCYCNTLLLTYTLENGTVSITSKSL